jgi:hypothetical protein
MQTSENYKRNLIIWKHSMLKTKMQSITTERSFFLAQTALSKLENKSNYCSGTVAAL